MAEKSQSGKSATPGPRVAARIAETRRRILDAARVVAAEEGFAASQVAVVAQVAGVATGSVYRHFPSKSSLFAEMLRTVCDRELVVVRAIGAEPDKSALQRLGDAVATFVDRALRGEGLAYAVIVEPMDPDVDQVRLKARADLAAAMAELIDEGVAAGEFPPQNSRLRGAAIVGAFLEAVVAPLANRSAVPIDHQAIAVEVAQFCQSAVSAAPNFAVVPEISRTHAESN